MTYFDRDRLFTGYSQTIGETDEYTTSLSVRVCDACGAVVADEETHVNFHENLANLLGALVSKVDTLDNNL